LVNKAIYKGLPLELTYRKGVVRGRAIASVETCSRVLTAKASLGIQELQESKKSEEDEIERNFQETKHGRREEK
jgi:hypothetical protein